MDTAENSNNTPKHIAFGTEDWMVSKSWKGLEESVRRRRALEEIVSENLKVIEKTVIGSWRKEYHCSVLVKFIKTIARSNMKNWKCAL